MEIVITNIGFEHNEVICMRDINRVSNDIEFSTIYISFDMLKNGKKLNGNHEMSFEKYRKMNHDDLTEHIKGLLL